MRCHGFLAAVVAGWAAAEQLSLEIHVAGRYRPLHFSRGDDYEAFKAKLTKRLLEPLLDEYPQIEAHIEHMELSTPLSTKTFCNFDKGEIYGLEHTPKRFKQDWLRPQTPIKGLYLTGADICSCGVGGAVFGGVLQVSAQLKRNLLGPIAKRAAEYYRPFDASLYETPEIEEPQAASVAV